MKFIVVQIPQVPGNKRELRPAGRNVAAYQEMLAEIEDQVRLADSLGFYAYATAEHHFHTEGYEVMSQPLIFYSKLAALTRNIKFIPLSMVPVATNPLRVAEQVAMFDNLFPGRMEVGMARGYQSRWMQTMAQDEDVTSGLPGTPSDTRNREIFEEYMEVIRLAWTEDAFCYSGKHIQIPYPITGLEYPAAHLGRELGSDGEVSDDNTVAKIGVVPKPYTQPFPQLWLPFSLSPATLTKAAVGGYNMILHASNPDLALDFMTRYRDEAAGAGRDLELGQGIAALRDIVIGETEEHAFELAVKGTGRVFHDYFQHFGFMEPFREPDDPADALVLFDTVEQVTQRMIDHRWIIAGTLETVIEQLEDTRTCNGRGANLEYIIYHMAIQGAASREESTNQLRLVGEKVLPHFA